MNVRFVQEDINEVALQVWQLGKYFTVWAFHAPMGAGKTTFISALCQHVLQVKDAVSSPTFALISEYESPVAGTIYHMDWYRLKGEEEAIQAGVEDCITSGCLCLVEWPENAPLLLPEQCFHIYIQPLNDTTRILTTGEEE